MFARRLSRYALQMFGNRKFKRGTVMSDAFEDMSLDMDAEVDINNPSQVQYWMQQWEVSERDLRMAVANVGTEVAELRIALGR
jgi:hypothetical protein